MLTTTGCPAPEQEPAEVRCAVEAAPAAAPVGGDANGDGHVDVSDGAYLARALLAAGPAPVCAAAVDLVPDGTINLGDIPAIWYAIGPRSAPYLPSVTAEACPTVARETEPACAGTLALRLDAPATVTGPADVPVAFDVAVLLDSPDLAVEAWSIRLRADGCGIDAGTTTGTDAADRAEIPPGHRDGGMAWQAVAPIEASVLTVLDWRTQGTLPPGTRTLHTFTVRGTPVSGCGTCTLTLDAGDPATGVETVISADGWRYLPSLGSTRVQLCPG